LTTQELVLVEVIHGDARAGNEVVLIAPVDDEGEPPADASLE